MALSFRVWVVISLAVTAVVGLLAFANVRSPVRPLVVLIFVLVVPGMALIRLVRLRDPLVELLLAIGLSIGVTTLAASAAMYASIYSWRLVLGLLIGITLSGTASELRQLLVGRRRIAANSTGTDAPDPINAPD